MISRNLNTALNTQMNKEFFSAYGYLACAGFYHDEELNGFANFFRIQAQEEVGHGMKIFDYIHRVGGHCVLEPVASPKKSFKTVLDPLESGLEKERELASEISRLYQVSMAEHHAPTQVFLQWFVNEQVEEEALFMHWVKRVQRVIKDSNGILRLDSELLARKPDDMSEGEG
jgi:ferritin